MIVSAEKAAEIIRNGGEYVDGKDVKSLSSALRAGADSYSLTGHFVRTLSYVDQALAGTYRTRLDQCVHVSCPFGDGRIDLKIGGYQYAWHLYT